MKINTSSTCKIILTIAISLIALFNSVYGQGGNKKIFMGIELNNVLCGYSEIYISDYTHHEIPAASIKQNTYFNFKALGRDIVQKQLFSYRINKETGNFFYHDSYTEQGKYKAGAIMTVAGDSLFINDTINNENKVVFLPENTVLQSTIYYPLVAEKLGVNNMDSITYLAFDFRTGEAKEIRYFNKGREKLTLNNIEYTAVIVGDLDPQTGMESRYWIDIESGLRLKMESPTGISMYLSDESVMNKMGVGNWDENIFIGSNEYIRNIGRITAMEVEAELKPVPSPALDDLNGPGQSFKGSINDKLVKGVFKVNHKRYSGEDALAFDCIRNFNSEVSKYLEPDDMIQSDKPEFDSLATEITKGSEDFWEATLRLSEWVIDNIDGSIVFGNAYETYQRREGACGSQSMLMAALCRAAGIPARVAWGALYIPEYGGGFGSHGWNEIYMGDKAGWVSLDVTIGEKDYINSGHIRLGIYEKGITIINFHQMNIIDYSLK